MNEKRAKRCIGLLSLVDFSASPVDASSEPLKAAAPRPPPPPIGGRSASNCFGVGDGTDGWPKRNTYPDISLFAE